MNISQQISDSFNTVNTFSGVVHLSMYLNMSEEGMGCSDTHTCNMAMKMILLAKTSLVIPVQVMIHNYMNIHDNMMRNKDLQLNCQLVCNAPLFIEYL